MKGIWTARVPFLFSLFLQAVKSSLCSGIQWIQAFEKIKSNLPSMFSSPCGKKHFSKLMSGYSFLAFSSIFSDASTPMISALLNLFLSACVLFPGPQPRSSMRPGSMSQSLAIRSFDGCVLSFANFIYWLEFQSDINITYFPLLIITDLVDNLFL